MAEPAAQPVELTLDELFGLLERMPVPEGHKVEIVGGTVSMSPQSRTHWEIIRRVLRQLENHFGRRREIVSDVRIDFPGQNNGFAPDLAMIAEGAVPNDEDRFSSRDVEFVLEVVSPGTGTNDYGPKLTVYAETGVPVYLIVDPSAERCRVLTEPGGGRYARDLTAAFGKSLDLSATPAELTVVTDSFPSEKR